jgi:hypothetical protein
MIKSSSLKLSEKLIVPAEMNFGRIDPLQEHTKLSFRVIPDNLCNAFKMAGVGDRQNRYLITA